MFEDSQNLVLETFLNPAKREKFRRWNQVFWGGRIGVVPFEKGKINRRQSEKLQFQLLKIKRFSVYKHLLFFNPLQQNHRGFFWSLETHHFGGTVDRKAPDFDRRTIGSKRAHWWRIQTPGGISMARLVDLNCWKIRPRKQFFCTKRVNWPFIRPFPSEWTVFFCSGGVVCDS